MGIADGVGIFHPQHGPRIAVHHVPGIGQVEPAIGGRGIGGGAADIGAYKIAGTAAEPIRLAAGADVPVDIGDGTGSIFADNGPHQSRPGTSRHHPTGKGGGDPTGIITDKPADSRGTGPRRNTGSGISDADGAAIGTHQSADILRGTGRTQGTRGIGAEDGAGIGRGQQGDIATTAHHRALINADTGQHTSTAHRGEQGDIADTGIVDIEVVDGVALAIQPTGEAVRRGVATAAAETDRQEARGRVPHARCAAHLPHVNITGQSIAGGQVQVHQLQLVGITDGRAVFAAQNGARIAFDQIPTIGEIKTVIGRGAEGSGSAEPDNGCESGAFSTKADGLTRGGAVPVCGGNEAAVEPGKPGDSAGAGPRRHAADGIGIGYGTGIGADKPGDIRARATDRHPTQRISVDDRAGIVADQPTDILCPIAGLHGCTGIGIGYRSTIAAQQTTDLHRRRTDTDGADGV